MEELHKKVIGNAQGAYFMILVSIFFLLNKKNPYIDHPFVRSHVKVAFPLHLILVSFLFFMLHYDFFGGIYIIDGISLNHIITTLGVSIIFSGILYAAFQAHNGKSLILGDIISQTGIKKEIFQKKESSELNEEEALHLIIAHIPFLGYITYPRHKNLPHIRDINMINSLCVFFALLLFIIGNTSLAQVILLAYSIWAVFQSILIITQKRVFSFQTDFIPGVEDSYILIKASIISLSRVITKKDFIPFTKIRETLSEKKQSEEKKNHELLQGYANTKTPLFLYYIPLVNFVGFFSLHTRQKLHIENGIILSILFIICSVLAGFHGKILILFLFPIFYGIGYGEKISYKMPFIHDIYEFGDTCIKKIIHIFHIGRKIKNTHTKESISMNQKTEEKKES